MDKQEKPYCSFFIICKKGYYCKQALTDGVIIDWAKKGGFELNQYSTFPDCYVRFFEMGDKQ